MGQPDRSQGTGFEILVAEDSPIQAEMLRRDLVKEGYRVRLTRDGEEALQEILSAPPAIALLDVVMPKRTGIEVCREIKTNPLVHFVPVVLVTVLEEQEHKIEGIEAGADDFLNKPVDMTELRARVRSLVQARRLYEELVQKNGELEKLNQQKNQFLGMAAHDLRNPLNAILKYSRFLQEEASDKLGSDQVDFLHQIRSSSEFMLNMVTDLLDITQIESGEMNLSPRPGNFARMTESSVSLNRVLASQKHITLEYDSPKDFPDSLFDSHKMEQVLNNLIGNAVKFSKSETRVFVSVQQDDGKALIRVKDEGQGIPESEIDLLFRPFSTTSVKGTQGEKSTGLGLSIVKNIVEAHGGQIGVTSEVQVGSTFEVSLPIQAIKLDADPGFQQAEGKRSLKIILAEDDRVNQRLASRILEKIGHKVDIANNGTEVLQLLECDPFDIILMDANMPEMDGYEATEAIRGGEVQPDIPIVALTGGISEKDRSRCLASGMDDYVSKPIQSDELRRVIEELTRLRKS
jgi:two-component system sensor histidine kinase/response regulator